MQKARRQAFPLRGIALRQFVSAWFQVLWTPLAGVLFTFPSRYWFTIGRSGVFSLIRWSERIQTGFLVSGPTWDPARRVLRFAYGAFTLCDGPYQGLRLHKTFVTPRLPCRAGRQSRDTAPETPADYHAGTV